MSAGRKWVERNLGYDPIEQPPPASTFAFAKAASSRCTEDLQREIIDFDSEAPSGLRFLAFTTATGLSRYVDVAWPKGLAPITGGKPAGSSDSPLPKADVLVVTWTVDEGHALSRVLTPGKDSHDDYLSYTHNFATISQKMRKGCPAIEAKRLGAYWTTTIGKKSVVVFKSDSHMSQDGPQLPNADVWRQIIQEVQPEPGDHHRHRRRHRQGLRGWRRDRQPDRALRLHLEVQEGALRAGSLCSAKRRRRNTLPRPARSSRPMPVSSPRPTLALRRSFVSRSPGLDASVVTTDFFGFDTSDNHYKLQGLGSVSEMGDAVLGLVAQEMGTEAPRWLAIRNVSDPQISATGLTLQQQGALAAQIYKGFGRWSTVCSAITCWASIAAD